jgi:3-oxoacyl-[acyl-carrier-protein] synthase-3
MGIDNEWIFTRTGVRERYHLGVKEKLIDLASHAAALALEDSNIEAGTLDMVIVATSTPDRISPGLAAELAYLSGAQGAAAVDMNGACSGFLYALDYGIARVEQGSADRVLIVGADAMSRLTNPTDPNTAFIFGDGAGAVVIEAAGKRACETCTQFLSFGSNGAGVNYLNVSRETGYIQMDGGEVYVAAVENMTEEIKKVLLVSDLCQDDIDYIVCHQANDRIVKAVARELGLSAEKVISYVDKFGNTSSASIPIALWQAEKDRLLGPGNRLVLAAFGAGFTWGAGVINWNKCVHQ